MEEAGGGGTGTLQRNQPVSLWQWTSRGVYNGSRSSSESCWEEGQDSCGDRAGQGTTAYLKEGFENTEGNHQLHGGQDDPL